MSTIANILKRHPRKIIAILLGIVACFTVIYINRDSIFSGPLAAGPVAAGPSAAGVVKPSITFGDVDLILNPDSDGGVDLILNPDSDGGVEAYQVEAYQVEYASGTKTDLGRNIDIGLKWTNGIGFTDLVTKITIERIYADGSTDLTDLVGGIGTKDDEIVNIILKGENIPDGKNVVGKNTFNVKYHRADSDAMSLLGTASVEILDSHLDKTITISDVTTLSFDPNVKGVLVASLGKVDFTRYDVSLKNSTALAFGSRFKSIRIEDSDVEGIYRFKTLEGNNLRFLDDKITKHKLKKYGEYYLISPIDDTRGKDLFYSQNEGGTGEPLKIISRDEVTTSEDLEKILFSITKSVGPPPVSSGAGLLSSAPADSWVLSSSYADPSAGPLTYTKLRSGDMWKVDEKYKSPNGQYEIIQQGDGNLVIYTGKRITWHSVTGGMLGARVKFWAGHLFMWDVTTNKHIKTLAQVTVYENSHIWALGNDGSLTIRDKDAKVLKVVTPADPFASWTV